MSCKPDLDESMWTRAMNPAALARCRAARARGLAHSATKPKRRTFICRECDHDAGENPIDTHRCKRCLHVNTLDLTEVQ
jgi:ribosomal protein L40E